MAKIMAPKRTGKKQYPLVTFTLDGFDGEFTLPDLNRLPLGVAAALADGELGKLLKFLHEYAPECAPVVEDLSSDEVEGFMDKWGKASGVDPKGS